MHLNLPLTPHPLPMGWGEGASSVAREYRNSMRCFFAPGAVGTMR
jgi:hypothetical protein